MRKSLLVSSSLAWCVAAFSASAATPANLAAQAHVKMAEARSIALKASPGKIVKEELEKESGGSGLRYSFDITAAGVTHEIGVDAKNGKILENSIDNGKD
jgi:Predicted membrane protein